MAPMTDLRMRFGAAFRRARLAQRISLPELSVATGIPVSSLSAYERGERWSGPDALARLMSALDINEKDLFGAADQD